MIGRPGVGSSERGVLLALGTAVISGLAVYLNAFGVKQVPDAAVYTTAKNGVAAVILVALALALGAGREARVLDGRRRLGLLLIAIVGGSIPFVLFFTGLAMATAPTAAFIHKTLFIWVAIMAVPLLGERIGMIQIGALGVLLLGQVLVAPPTGMGWGMGETLIAAATLMWSVEVILAKRLLRGVSAPLLGAARMGLGVLLLLGYLAVTGRLGGLLALTPEAWLWVAITGVLLAGYVATWFAALRATQATTVTSVLVLAAVVTGTLSAVANGTTPDLRVLAGYGLIAAGVALAALMGSSLLGRSRAIRPGADA